MMVRCRYAAAVLGVAAVILGMSACGEPDRSEAGSSGVDSVSAIILEEALAALARADFSAAMGFAEGVEARQPGLVETQYVKGQIYYELHLFDEAEEHWLNVVEAEPDYWLWWQNLGDVAFRKLEFREAADYYRMAASLDENPLAWQGLAGAYVEMGFADSAAYALERAIEVDSMHAPAYLSLSVLAEEEGDLDGAYALAQRALALDPASAETTLAAGLLAFKREEYDSAIPLLSHVLEADPANHAALHNLAQSLQRTGRAEEADHVFTAASIVRSQEAALKVRRDAVQNNPRNPTNYLALGEALHETGRVDEALRAYKTADLMVPADPHIRHTIATLHLEKGDFSEAILRFFDIIHRDSTFVEAWLNLGVAYARMDEMERAKGVWEEASRRFPGHPGVRQVLTRVNRIEG